MVRIRLKRFGRKHAPTYRVVAADSRSPRDGRVIEYLGFYNPRTQPTTFKVKEERIKYWLEKGAQPSETVERLLKRFSVLTNN